MPDRKKARFDRLRSEANGGRIGGAETKAERNLRSKRARTKEEDALRKAAERAAAATRRPELTPKMAMEFARLLASGVPPSSAVGYLNPRHAAALDKAGLDQWADAVSRSRLVLSAVNELNGAAWQDLEPSRRLQLAMDKFLAECAFVLYTNSYSDAIGALASKMDSAANRLRDYLGEKGGGDDTPWRRFVEEFMHGFDKDRPVPSAVPAPGITIES